MAKYSLPHMLDTPEYRNPVVCTRHGDEYGEICYCSGGAKWCGECHDCPNQPETMWSSEYEPY